VNPGAHAITNPTKIAALLAETGETLTYAELERRSVQLAHVLWDAGLRRGDVLALLTDNDLRAFEVYWGCMRSGLYVTAVNHHLTPEEVAYIVNDSGATALVVAAAKSELAEALVPLVDDAILKLSFGGDVTGYGSYEHAVSGASAVPFDDQPHGGPMLYSSGTTGRPKGVRPPLPDVQVSEPGDPLVLLAKHCFAVGPDTVYLSPAPVYHAAPLRWSAAVQALGGTVVMTARFDAERTLRAVEDHRVTHAQFVPTMFVRMLQLPEEVRSACDVSSLTCAIHAAAPCPVEVKQKMIDWWGPVLVEYYAATEGYGMTMVDSPTWLVKRGTVGKAVMGEPHVCHDEGKDVATGEIGTLYFARDHMPFVYHEDPERTAAAVHPFQANWTTVGDVGYLDEDGYLFLTDRKAFTIISGGVNIYPQEIENALALHPAIHDVAVIGLPDPEMGETVTAFVQPAPGAVAGPELEREIVAFARTRIAGFKVPRNVRFVDELPRTETGKLVKGELKRRYGV
jgi:long-chain acyl-CoA synthetase